MAKWLPSSHFRGVPHTATYLSATIRLQSIKVYLYGVHNLHLKHGFPCPLQGALQLRRLLRGIKRTLGLSPDTRLPITPSLLRRFFSHLDLSYYDHSILWTACLLSFFGLLRGSELLALRPCDLVRHPHTYTVTIHKSKCDPF